MKTNDSANACPKCGTPVPAEAPEGLCPRCVLAAASAPEPAPTATSQIPSLERLAVAFPQLQIIELIGRGGMGFVFKARQPHLDRFVALKLLPDSLAHDPQFAERFNREGRVLARLNHPNIVSIFDFGQAGGFYYLMMEYVDGVNLRQAMRAGRFSPAEALTIVPKICEALQFAHEEGILHRDIKPENILLDSKGRVKIADFGIAKLVGEEHPDVSLTATGAALGTMHYMAPEQIEKPSTVDHRADIYSLGVVFYELLTGELPLGRFGPPSERTPVDPRVDDVVMRTLEKEREKRFQSAGEMGTSVEHLTEVGAGTFKAAPPKAPGAEPQRGPGGTMVINPSAVIPPAPAWSLKAIISAALVGLSLLLPLLSLAVILLKPYRYEEAPAVISFLYKATTILLLSSIPAFIGTILGSMALSDIRAHQGRLRGLPFAVFATLTWPLMVLLASTLSLPTYIFARSDGGLKPLFALLLIIPAAAITFAIWAVYAAARWGRNEPVSQRGGVLKWIFLGLMLSALGSVTLSTISKVQRDRAFAEANEDRLPTPPDAMRADIDTPPWIRFTFTAVELREVQGVRWLAIDYLDDVQGECQKSFPWETTIPGFKATTRTSEFLGGDTNAPVRHQRVEYQMPDSIRRDQLERLRDRVARTLERKSFRLELGEEKLLFEMIPMADGTVTMAPPESVATEKDFADIATGFGGSLKARIKVVPPLNQSAGNPTAAAPLSFGPVFERVITSFSTDAATGFLDFETGEYRVPPTNVFRELRTQAGQVEVNQGSSRVSSELREWLKESGADLMGGQMINVASLLFFEATPVNHQPPLSFDTIVPSQVTVVGGGAQALVEPGVFPVLMIIPTRLWQEPWKSTKAIPFRTREGNFGVMEVIGLTEKPSGVKIRYKMLQSDKDNADGIRIRLAHEELAAARKKSDAGLLSQYDLAQAERQFAIATTGGDAVAAARMNLEFAQASLTETKRRVEVGVLAPLELKLTESRLALAETDLKEALKTDSVTVKKLQAESTPQNEAGANARALQFRLVAGVTNTTEPIDVMQEAQGDGRRPRTHLVLRPVLMDGSAVARAGIQLETNGSRTIGIELTAEGARRFESITASNVMRQLAIVSGGRVLSAPIIRTAIPGGELNISGGMSAAEVHQLVAELNRKPAGLEFSAVIERSLPRPPEGPAICLDLDTGYFKTNHTFRNDQRATRDWLQTCGVDLLAIGTADQIPVLDAFDLASIEAPANAWDSMLPQDIGWNWALMRNAAQQESQLATTNGFPVTFLFRTRENGFGLLQILSVTNPAPEVKIRYKLVLDAAAPRAIPASAQNHSFGPVVVRTLAFNESLQDGFLDLNTGRLLTPPKDIAALFKTAYGTRLEWERKPDPRAVKMRAWLQASGANLMAWGGEYPERLEMREGFAINPPWTGTNHVGFDRADPNVVAKQADIFLKRLLSNSVIKIPLLQPGYDAEAGQRQDTLQFMTREGTIGVLQILNTENNPRGVKIRYKLVQSDKDDADEIRIRLAREELAAARKQFAAGFLSQYELAQAERQFAAAEARGDAVAAAQANLKFAEESLTATKERFAKGVISSLDLKFAESRYALAKTDADLQALRKREQELRATYTDQHPMLQAIRLLIVKAEQEQARQEKAQ